MTLDLNLGLYLSVNHRPRHAKLLGVQPPSPSQARGQSVKVMQGKKHLGSSTASSQARLLQCIMGKRAAEQGGLGSQQGNRGGRAGEGGRWGLAGLCLGSGALIPPNRDGVKLCRRSPFRPCRAHPRTRTAPARRQEEVSDFLAAGISRAQTIPGAAHRHRNPPTTHEGLVVCPTIQMSKVRHKAGNSQLHGQQTTCPAGTEAGFCTQRDSRSLCSRLCTRRGAERGCFQG